MLICKVGQESGMKLESRIRYELYDLQVEFLRHLATGDGNSIRYDAEELARTHEAFFFFFYAETEHEGKEWYSRPQ